MVMSFQWFAIQSLALHIKRISVGSDPLMNWDLQRWPDIFHNWFVNCGICVILLGLGVVWIHWKNVTQCDVKLPYLTDMIKNLSFCSLVCYTGSCVFMLKKQTTLEPFIFEIRMVIGRMSSSLLSFCVIFCYPGLCDTEMLEEETPNVNSSKSPCTPTFVTMKKGS